MISDDADFREGARLYAEGRYWDAHEAWEKRWRIAIAPEDASERLLLQALIQVAAALYKVFEKKEPESAARLFVRAVTKLEALPDSFGNLQIASFRDAAIVCRDVLEHDQDGGTLNATRVPRLIF